MVGNRLPQRMLDHRETPFGFIDWRGARAADFFGVPGFGNEPLQGVLNLFAFGCGQVAMVLRGELRGDRVVFLDQRAPRHFRGVRGQHQFDFQPRQLPRQRFGTVAFVAQTREQFRQHAGFERRRLRLLATMNQLILLGDVRQVEKLVERARHGEQFVFAQLIEAGAQFGVHRTTPIGLGALADLLDLVEESLAVLISNGVAQQLSEQVNVFAQACINIGHQQFPSSNPDGLETSA
ncbi:hypothetical protein D3C87_992560 [compost metagenome]